MFTGHCSQRAVGHFCDKHTDLLQGCTKFIHEFVRIHCAIVDDGLYLQSDGVFGDDFLRLESHDVGLHVDGDYGLCPWVDYMEAGFNDSLEPAEGL